MVADNHISTIVDTIWTYDKDDDYTIEDVINNKYKHDLLHYANEYVISGEIDELIYILKDKIWYCNSPDTDFILIPWREFKK